MNDIWIIHLIDLIDGQMPQFNKRQFETGAFVENATLMHECIRDAVNRLEGMILKEIPHDRLTMFLLGVVSDFLLEFADYIPTSMEDIKWFRYGNEDEDDDMWYHWGIEEFVTAINKLIIKFNIPEDDNIKTLYERTWFVKDFTYEKKWMKENMSIDAVNRFKNLGVLPFLCDNEQAPEGNSSTPEPQPKPTRGRGRPQDTFKDKLIDDIDGSKLQKIHLKMKGKKGKDAALIMLACMKKGWLIKPTYTQVKNEFGDIGTQQAFTPYLNKIKFSNEEIEFMANSLD